MTDFDKRFIRARRAVIRADFKQLNDCQQEAVLATEGPLLILAGAGSGKTTVLINRIANLLRYGRASDSDELPDGADEAMLSALEAGGERARCAAVLDPVEPWRILAITFTNKAAGELKDRLERMLGPDAADDVWACTFHSACVRILRRDAERLGFPSNFTIYDAADSQSLVKHIIRDMDLDEKSFPPRSLLAEISRAKDAQIGASEFLNQARAAGDIRRRRVGEVYAEYMRRMFAAGAMDFDDLISFTVKLLQEHEDVREHWQRRFRYVLIDEYQDTNHLQYLLASILAEGWGNICVVGDDDQSIYKFRGATIENILSFEEQYKHCRVIRLEQNYRSTGHILDAANAVIRNNVGRKGKELWTEKDSGELIKLYVADNENDEAQYVASCIMGEYGRGANWRDHAILYRMNAQSNQLEYAFKRNGIPYRIIGGTRFFDRAEVKDVLAYLCVISSPSDDLRLTRIINNPPRGIGPRSVELAQQIAAREQTSLYDVLCRADRFEELSRSALRMRQFAALIGELHEKAGETGPDLLLDELLDKTGYLRMLEEKNTVEDTARAENVRELKSSILGYMKESGDNTLEGFLADVALYTDLDAYDKDADCVVMMTMHSAKGLEFPTVFLVGMEESIFPSIRAIGEPEEMEEERRLCYVAITRAMRRLHIVCARQRMLFGRTTANRVSRFVDEIPEEHIEKKNVPKGYGYRDKREETSLAYRAPKPQTHRVSAPSAAPAAKTPPAFAVGDHVVHKAFGPGVFRKMTPMGGDFLIEVEFEKVGTKKLMLRVAAQMMKKA
ncbi:MAG: UvrD-helicase domain-containing protein [Oscillospiraceae bacterium]|nr:UvrD-helicase domain-containing protein [Oscillospiraceae bacterium]MBQ6465904.1 UvrD-helicase domain-containing protein [Oscillospiraceae bacterium]